ncbi:hypothetical protein ABB37_08621 [Leptomonas pyrrhocoris]|uniref:Transmembrane protein n=1 Tax=Leptomonas pyrrhocoris TaxID=157538 RepID=A0A0M9FSX5_LEPPY|nr:hypothetical protein ABB37_08621 [Leptomonas pyrrhocoris]KPA75327.1 hypothetical protein ABB37_08621 [Leptomonas pyrrhocoris]|eukprot:XP_015653766.1 hypothetical protein ABB37_08621 [Leptomonas pyrrhocoris]
MRSRDCAAAPNRKPYMQPSKSIETNKTKQQEIFKKEKKIPEPKNSKNHQKRNITSPCDLHLVFSVVVVVSHVFPLVFNICFIEGFSFFRGHLFLSMLSLSFSLYIYSSCFLSKIPSADIAWYRVPLARSRPFSFLSAPVFPYFFTFPFFSSVCCVRHLRFLCEK